jgi:hypothetical protein
MVHFMTEIPCEIPIKKLDLCLIMVKKGDHVPDAITSLHDLEKPKFSQSVWFIKTEYDKH